MGAYGNAVQEPGGAASWPKRRFKLLTVLASQNTEHPEKKESVSIMQDSMVMIQSSQNKVAVINLKYTQTFNSTTVPCI